MSTDSFAALYARYYRLILTVAEQRMSGISEAQDVVSEVFRIAWSRDMQGEEVTLPWLYQTLRNIIGNEYRRAARAEAFTQGAGPVLVEDILDPADDDALTIRRALRTLDEGDRELIYMAYWEDLTREEIAEILGCRVGAVRQRLRRARKRLEDALQHLAPSFNKPEQEVDHG